MTKVIKKDNSITLSTIVEAKARTYYKEGQLVYIEELGRWYVITSTSDLEDAPQYRIIDTAGTLKLKRANTVLYNTFRDDEGVRFHDEVGIGTIESPKELVVGEGDSTTEGMLVYQYNGVTYTDISADASSLNGSGFTFPGNNVGDSIYVSIDRLQNGIPYLPKGIKTKIDSPADYTTGGLEFQYWTGSTWSKFNIMSIIDKIPYNSLANLPFQADSQDSEQIYFDIDVSKEWEINDPVGLGNSTYWFRIIITAPLTTLPVMEQFKIHTSRSENNSDGVIQFFGNGRGSKTLNWSLGDLEAANASPGNQDVYISDTLSVGRVENAFANNSDQRSGFNIRLPEDVDTSSKLKLRVTAISTSTNAGNIVYNIRSGYTKDGDSVYNTTGNAPTTHPTQVSQIFTDVAPFPALRSLTYDIEIDISQLNAKPVTGPKDANLLWVTFERTGNDAADTFTGTVALVSLDAKYVTWSSGTALELTTTKVVDLFEDFESNSFATNGWTTINNVTNAWIIGTDQAESGTYGAYISNDGVNATYTATTSVSHLYVDVPIDAAALSATLAFNWLCEAEDGPGVSDYDFMKVYAIPTSTNPVVNVQLNEADRIGSVKYLEQSTWQAESLSLPPSFISNTVRIVFSFVSDFSIANNPGACLDNIQVSHII